MGARKITIYNSECHFSTYDYSHPPPPSPNTHTLFSCVSIPPTFLLCVQPCKTQNLPILHIFSPPYSISKCEYNSPSAPYSQVAALSTFLKIIRSIPWPPCSCPTSTSCSEIILIFPSNLSLKLIFMKKSLAKRLLENTHKNGETPSGYQS